MKPKNSATNMTVHIKNCLTTEECAIKPKHIRLVILKCFQSQQGPMEFWQAMTSKEYTDTKNYIIFWKLCQLIHQVFNKGPVQCIELSAVYWSNNFVKIGNIYQNNNYRSSYHTDNYYACIAKYIKLITTKINFYYKYKSFILPDLQIAEKKWMEDYDAVEMLTLANDFFEYLEDIIILQENIFNSTITYSIESVKTCRYMALSTLIDESKILYFTLIIILNFLHRNFTNEILVEQDLRFNKIFYRIKEFYNNSSKINFLKNVMWIPKMSSKPPEFAAFNAKENVYINQEMEMYFSYEKQPEKNPNYIEDEDADYDSDFSSNEENIDGNQSYSDKSSNNRHNYSIQKTLSSPSPYHLNNIPNEEYASAPSLDIILEKDMNTIKSLKTKIKFFEQQITLKNHEIAILKQKHIIQITEITNLREEVKNLNEKLHQKQTVESLHPVKSLNNLNDYTQNNDIVPFKNKKQQNLNLIGNSATLKSDRVYPSVNSEIHFTATKLISPSFSEWVTDRMNKSGLNNVVTHTVPSRKLKDDKSLEIPLKRITDKENNITSKIKSQSLNKSSSQNNTWREIDFLLTEFDPPSNKISNNDSIECSKNRMNEINKKSISFDIKPRTINYDPQNSNTKSIGNIGQTLKCQQQVNKENDEKIETLNFNKIKSFWSSKNLIS